MRTGNLPSYAVLRGEYFNGHSPIEMDGIKLHPLKDKSLPALIPWLQIIQAKVLSSQEVELMISTINQPLSTLQVHLKLDEQLEVKDIVSAINTIVLIHKTSF